MTQAANSALSSARLRFVEGLPARAEELSSTAERLARNPSDPEAAAMLRRRLHALLASAQVFEERALSLAVQDLIARLDIAQRAERPFTREEIDAVGTVVASLPTYVRPTLQPAAAYSDVRELRKAERATEPAPSESAADGGKETWRPPARRAKAPEVSVPQSAPVITSIEPDEELPAALADAPPEVARDLEVERRDVGAARAFELAEGRAEERPLPARARRIVALAALQPGNAAVSFEPEADEAAPITATVAALDEREPGQTAEMLVPNISELVTNRMEDSWSAAVAAAGEAMAAWRESMRAPGPARGEELSSGASGADEAGREEARIPSIPPAWLELNRLESDADSIVGDTFGVQRSIERNSLAAAAAEAEPEPIPALPEALEAKSLVDDVPERELREDIAEWGDLPTELHARSQTLPAGADELNAEPAWLAPAPLEPVVDVRLPEPSPALMASAQVADPDADSSATIGFSIDADNGIVEPDFSDETSPGFGPPVLLRQTVSGLRPTHEPARVLFVAEAGAGGRARADLSREQFHVVYAGTADEAIRSLHESKPDLVLVAADLASAPEADLLRRLKHDPLSQVSRVFVVMPEHATYDESFLEQIGADGAVREPLTDAALEPLLRASDEPAPAARGSSPPAETTIDAIAAQIAEEIRRGIAESLRTGQQETVRPADGSQLMAAAWSAIGRVRSHLADQKRDRDGDSASSSSLLPAADPAAEGNRTPSIHPSQLLAGHRVLVADDDPAVLWFFVGLLREASAQVSQAHNGREALELARRKQPHVIISDILMPKLDGFGLCRELKRDALLSHVPVILLSWKDDLLQRMRELDAGAAGYLRKEAGSQQILAQLTEVLEPRTRLVTKLRGQSEVSGPLSGLGALSLLEIVAAERPDAHITVRDAWNLFEVDIRAGRRLSVTRTAADGTFTRGEKALMMLLGTAGGEFHVTSSSASLKAQIPEPLERALAAAGRRLSALVDAVSDARLLRVSLVAFDDEVVQSLSTVPGSRLHEVIALFRTGNATAEGVLREGRYAPGELEGYLRELARAVAITGVWGANGEDLVLAAQRERETPQLALLSSTLPPRTRSGTWSLAPELREKAATLSTRPTEPIPPPQVEPPAKPEPEPIAIPPASAAATPNTSSTETAPAVAAATGTESSAPVAAPEETITAAAMEPAASTPASPQPSAADPLEQTKPGLGPSEPTVVPDWLQLRAPATTTIAPPASTEAALVSAASLALAKAPAVPDEAETDAVSKAELESFDLPIPSAFARAVPQRIDTLRLAGTLVVLAAVGYIGWQQFALSTDANATQTRVDAAKEPPPPSVLRPAPEPPPPAPPAPAASQPTPPPVAPPTIQNTQFGKVLPFVDTSRGVAVAPDEGLLVIELQGSDPAPNVRVGTRELGKPPIAVALPAGRHELVVRSGKSTSFRYLVVRPGETRIVSVPLAEL